MSVWLKWQSIGVYLPHELRQITLMTLKASQSHIVYLVLPDHICTMSPCKNFPILLSGRLPTCTTGSSLFFKNMFSEKNDRSRNNFEHFEPWSLTSKHDIHWQLLRPKFLSPAWIFLFSLEHVATFGPMAQRGCVGDGTTFLLRCRTSGATGWHGWLWHGVTSKDRSRMFQHVPAPSRELQIENRTWIWYSEFVFLSRCQHISTALQ